MNDLVKSNGFDISPETFEDAWRMCKALASSELVPKDYRNKPENVLVAAQMGAELGLKPLQAIQNVAVINGRPAVWGDALLAIVRGHPQCEDVQEWIEGDGEAAVAFCVVKRRGQSATQAQFSVADAKKASLWNKAGPWQQYPRRMLQLRARSFALRDSFADALRGIQVAEEVRDYHDGTVVQAEFGDRAVAPPKKSATDALLERHKPDPASELMQQINAAETVVDLKAVARRIRDSGVSDTAKAKLREAYEDAQARLQPPEEPEPAQAPEPDDFAVEGFKQAIREAGNAMSVHALVSEAADTLSQGDVDQVSDAANARLAELNEEG